MQRRIWCALAAALAGCSQPQKNAASPAKTAASNPPRITQLYATVPHLPLGDKGLICYGVENAKTVWLEPPRQELSAALARCVEVSPKATTTYTLTAEGAGGPPATQALTITVGAARVHIVDVTVSSLAVKPGDLISLCVRAENAAVVEIEPLRFRSRSPSGPTCTQDTPRKTTTYVISATGADGNKDQEHVTVKVR